MRYGNITILHQYSDDITLYTIWYYYQINIIWSWHYIVYSMVMIPYCIQCGNIIIYHKDTNMVILQYLTYVAYVNIPLTTYYMVTLP